MLSPAKKDPLLQLYCRVIEERRDSFALHAPDGSLTFGELDQASNKLVNVLKKTGCSDCIIFLPPSALYIASLVACMKAGIPAVIVEPEQYNAHVNGRFSDKNTCCLTSHELITKAEKTLEVPAIAADKIRNDEETTALVNTPETSGMMPLHRIFTSGSSGQPKMATINRESEYVHAKEAGKLYNYKTGQAYANLGRHTSSLIVNGFWRVILSGSCFIFFDLKKENFRAIHERLKLEKARGLQGPSSIMKKFIHETQGLEKLSGIDSLIFGGEPLPVEILKAAYLIFSPSAMITLNYSSTECMMISTFTLPIKEALKLKKIPAGVPVPSKIVKLIDEHGTEVEQGTPGRVVVTSKYIASAIEGEKAGTLIETESKPGYRTFFTSDLAKLNENGHIEILGRVDRTVKINGVRVEINSIENVLNQLSGISKSIVVPVDVSKNNKQLFACLVRSDNAVSNSEIYDELKQRFNSAHLPTHIIDLKTIPLNMRGKTDFEKIKEACLHHITKVGHVKEAFKSKEHLDVHNNLIDFWSQVLKKPIAKQSGSFFSEGGDSLSSAELVGLINSAYKLKLEVAWIFKHPTLKKQAEFLFKSTSAVSGESAKEKNQPGLSAAEVKELLGF